MFLTKINDTIKLTKTIGKHYVRLKRLEFTQKMKEIRI